MVTTKVALHFSHALVMGIVTFLTNIRALVVSPVSLEPKVPGSLTSDPIHTSFRLEIDSGVPRAFQNINQ